MSRVANYPVNLPSGVEITQSGQLLSVKGSKGTLSLDVHPAVEVKQEEGTLLFAALNSSKESRAMSGTTRALVNNMVEGVSAGYERKLELQGVGYRVRVTGNVVNLSLGFSNPVDYELPEGISAEAPTVTEVILRGVDKQKIGHVAAEIRGFRPPEPYKGKGVRYAGEQVRRKEAKKK